MEPLLPAPPEEPLGPAELAAELDLADVADGLLPHFLSEQRPTPTAAQAEAQALAEQDARGEQAWEKIERKEGKLSRQEWTDLSRNIDPAGRNERSRKRYR